MNWVSLKPVVIPHCVHSTASAVRLQPVSSILVADPSCRFLTVSIPHVAVAYIMIPLCVKWCATRPSSIGSIEASPTAPAMVVRGQCVANIETDSSYTKLRCHYHLTDGVLHSGNDTLVRHTRLRNSSVCLSSLLWLFWLFTIVHRCTTYPDNIFVESNTVSRVHLSNGC